MTPDQISELRHEVLAQLWAFQSTARDVPAIRRGMVRTGVHATAEEVESALSYLEGKELVTHSTDPLSSGRRLWSITSAGIDLHESR